MSDDGGRPGYVYVQVADHLTARIESGELRPNMRLPGERQLAEEYGVSLGSVRHATRLLRYRGLVVTLRAKGTFVAPAPRRDSDPGGDPHVAGGDAASDQAW